MMSKNKRPQMPKRRNFVAKNMNKFNRPQTHRDRTKYDRYEDYLKDQLDDMVDGLDKEAEAEKRAEFKSKLAGEEYDPDGRKNYEDWLQRAEIAEDWYPYEWDETIDKMAKEIAEEVDRQIIKDLIDDDDHDH